LRARRFHSWDVTPKEAVRIQRRLVGEVILEWSGGEVSTIAAADVGFPSRDVVRTGLVVVSFPKLEVLETQVIEGPTRFPYVPGLLAFREAPSVLETLDQVCSDVDLLLLDGQGIAHPRSMGLATHLGLVTGIPSIGCAKSVLYGEFDEPGADKGDYSYIYDKEGRKIGAAVRTRDNVKPVYVSPGNLIDIENSIGFVLNCATRYRIPEPLRLAHKAASGRA
jgi:deoxyribonuclease V